MPFFHPPSSCGAFESGLHTAAGKQAWGAPEMAPARQPLAPRDGNVPSPAPLAFEAKGFVSAYDLLRAAASPLSDASPARVTAAAREPGPREAPTGRGAPAVPAPAAQTAPHAPAAPSPSDSAREAVGPRAVPHASPTAARHSEEEETRVGAHTGAAERAAGSLEQLARADDARGAGPAATLLPPSWDDMLQMVAELPLPSKLAGAAQAAPAADKPAPTTVGLMVKPDPEHDGLGVVTGFVEGSSADLSGAVMAGDVVLAVDGMPFNHPDAVRIMRGGPVVASAGVQMRLTLERHGSAFECGLVREPTSSVQLKHELFEALAQLKESLDALPLPVHIRMSHEPEFGVLLAAVQDKLMELEKSSLSSLHLLRSELHGLQEVMERIVGHIQHAADDGDDVIRSLTERIADQEDHIGKLSAKVDELLLAPAGVDVHGQQPQAADDHGSQDQLHLLRHECNRLRSSLQSREFELEGLRESFNRKLEEQGLVGNAPDGSTGYQGLKPQEQGQVSDARYNAIEEELKIAQTRLEQEGEASNMEIAALKRDLWVSVIRRWLNNCCRRVITGWRSEVARKQYFRVVCCRREQTLRSRCSRGLLQRSFFAFCIVLSESKRLRHAGVTAASGWLFLCVRKHLHAWLARVDWKAYVQRLESKCKAKAAARVFHCWSRVPAQSAPGLDSEMVAAIMSPTSTASILPKAAQVMADAKATLSCAQEHTVGIRTLSQSKPASVDKGMQSLKWESDASVQCALDGSDHSAPRGSVLQHAQVPKTTSCTQTAEQALCSKCSVATVSTASQSDAVEDLCFPIVAVEPGVRSQKDSAVVFRRMQENLDVEQRESRRLREKLATALESVKRHEEFLKSAQDSDRRLKESLQVAHGQLHRALRGAEEDRRRATQLGQELEQVERKLLMAHEERNELRTIVSDERRKNARGHVGNGIFSRTASMNSRYQSPPQSRQLIPRHDCHSTKSSPPGCLIEAKNTLATRLQPKTSVRSV